MSTQLQRSIVGASRFAAILSLVIVIQSPAPAFADVPSAAEKGEALEKDVTQGALRIVGGENIVECPLKHTDVQAEVSGFIARVKVTQTFTNPSKDKIEAVYVFPLPHQAAVDDMTMLIGDRKIVGVIKRRAEARSIYEQALMSGQTAALLEQERPNIFTQSVGNIAPGQEVRIEISYVDVLRYDLGTYEFAFPMVVGPRYNPGPPSNPPVANPPELAGKVAPPAVDTTRVPDASRISPPVLKPGYRTSHDISLSVNLDAGVPIQDLKSTNHKADIVRGGETTAAVKLSSEDALPNKDFVLRYGVVGKKPEMAVLAHTGEYHDSAALGSGYFMLMIQPKEDERLTKSPPREIVFLVDVSGSMSGEPTAKVVDAMQRMLKLCREQDTVQVITFASEANKLFEKPVPVKEENIKKALAFTEGLQGGGGTEMLKGVQMAIDEPIDRERLRIVVMLTDGYIGNEAEIVEHVGKHCGDQIRFWCIGIGSSPNMFLVDGVAKQGGGMGKVLGLNDDSQALTQEVMTRIQRAQLAKIKIDWGDFKVAETFPAKIPELWAGRPVVIFGRYSGGGMETTANVSGNVEGEEISWPLKVALPSKESKHDVLAKVWARQKIEDLMHQTYYQGSPAVEEEVTALALDYRLMSQYTSFVAVDEKEAGRIAAPATPPRRMLVPVPLPEGTRYEGFFGPAEGEYEYGRVYAIDPMFDGAEKAKSPYRGRGMERLSRVRGEPEQKAKQLSAFGAMPGLAQRSKSQGYYESRRGELSAAAPLVKNRSYFARNGSSRGAAAATPAPVAAGLGRRQARPQALRKLSDVQKAVQPVAELEEEKLEEFSDFDGDFGYTGSALSSQAEAFYNAGQKALQTATEEPARADAAKQRAALVRAYLLDQAAANFGYGQGENAEQSAALLADVHARQVQTWAEKLPKLGAKLDLVLRDRSVKEALDEVGKAAGIAIKVDQDSLDDAAALLMRKELRVSYLDLRGATVAQALDWILTPARLNWQPDGGSVIARTDRRGPGTSAWVYDASLISIPSAEEFEKLDEEKKIAAAQKAAEDVIAAARKQLGAKDDSLVWYAPGQLLLFGSAEQHAAAAKLLADLADPKANLKGEAAELQKVTSKRAADRKDQLAKWMAARDRAEAIAVLDHYSWQLLAAAAGGKLDLEALTELRIVWAGDHIAELLKGNGAGLVLRSLWILNEAARALPKEEELADTVGAVGIHLTSEKDAVKAALAALEKNDQDLTAMVTALYGALAMPEGDTAKNARELLKVKESQPADSHAATVRLLASSLLSESADIDRKGLVDLVSRGVEGDELIVLTALACRRADGDVWEAFRAASRDILGEQPLSGSVVVLVNRLAAPRIPIAVAKR